MSEDTDAVDLLPALRDLMQSAGWQLLKAQAEREWGPVGYGAAMERAIVSIPNGPDRPYELARVAEQVHATAKAVHALMVWPEEQIKQLTPKATSSRWQAGIRGLR